MVLTVLAIHFLIGFYIPVHVCKVIEVEVVDPRARREGVTGI